jgi:hypothetical protein
VLLAVLVLAVVELADHKVLLQVPVEGLAAVALVVVALDHKVRLGLAVEALGHKPVQLVVALADRKQVVAVLGS